MKILKLNSISAVADPVFRGYEYSDNVTDPDGILLRSHSMHNDVIPDSLLAVARAGAGVNNIPLDACSERGIVVFNTPGANANAVKELVLCELLLGARKVAEGAAWVKTICGDVSAAVEEHKAQFAGRELAGKKLGVVGLGAIGAMVANAAIALGMRVAGYDPHLSVKSAWAVDRRVEFAPEADDILTTCDFITLHAPLTPETEGFLDAKALAKCKDGVVIVNNARGGLVKSADMAEALASGKVARYFTDFPDEILVAAEGAFCVPHLGASTEEAEDNCAYMAATQLKDYLENGNIVNGVNYPSVFLPRTAACRLCVHHKNVQSILSKILSIVAAQGVNVAHMADKSRGEYAYLILELDEAPRPESLELLKNLEGVLRVRML